MSTLHETTELTKKIGLWGGIGIVALLVIIFTFRAGKAIKNYFLPPGPPPPTVQFGKLPKPIFPESSITETLTYTLDTISGVLPSFPPQLQIYPIIWETPSLLDLDRAKEKARTIGFIDSERKIADEVYQWTGADELKRTLTMNSTSLNYTLTSEYTTSPSIINGTAVPDENDAIEVAKNYLAALGLLQSDIDISKTIPELYTLKNGQLLPATSLSTTQIVRVDLFQKDIDTLPMYYPNPPHSVINFLVGSGNTVVQSQYFYQKINPTGSTYPIITAEEAFQMLKDGSGYIGAYFGTSKEIKITDVTLGYYISGTQQEYLTPIVVFRGNSGFFAYVPAIEASYLK